MKWFKNKKSDKKQVTRKFGSTEDALRDDKGIKKEIPNLLETMNEYFKQHPEARNKPWVECKDRIKTMNDARHHDFIEEES